MNALTFVEIWLSLLTIWLQIVSGYSIKVYKEGNPNLRHRRSSGYGDVTGIQADLQLAQLLRRTLPQLRGAVEANPALPFGSDYPTTQDGHGGDDEGLIGSAVYPDEGLYRDAMSDVGLQGKREESSLPEKWLKKIQYVFRSHQLHPVPVDLDPEGSPAVRKRHQGWYTPFGRKR